MPAAILRQLVFNPREPLIFNTGLFLLLFLALLFGYQFVHRRPVPRTLYLTLFSLYFYYKAGGWFVLLLAGSAVAGYLIGDRLHRTTTRRGAQAWLALGIGLHLGVLGWFKYTNFLLGVLRDLRLTHHDPLRLVLPVGISFYTFQLLSYLIDLYRRKLEPAASFLDFAFYVTFFPHLVAGPIVRAVNFLPQIRARLALSIEERGEAFFLIATGLFKKAVISDYVSVNFVDRIFDAPSLYSGLENLLAVWGYALQIYCDFSGYSDMAIGVALLLGYRLGVNFNLPYQAASPTEFWRRWHISLSSWLRDYLYIPLGGNRGGKLATHRNLMITMLLGGLWHGASWTFVFWGFLHGLALALDKLVEDLFVRPQGLMARVLGTIVTFNFICFGWIFFRARDFASAGEMIGRIAGGVDVRHLGEVVAGYGPVMLLMVVGYLSHFMPRRLIDRSQLLLTRLPMPAQSAVLAAVIWFVAQVKSAEIRPYIYFQF